MNYKVAQECTLLSEEEKITFPEVVNRLDKADIELYYVDLLAESKTYYSNNEAFVVPFSIKSDIKVGSVFNADHVEQALRLIQSGQIKYQEFLRKIMDAGTVCYFVYIKGRKASYIGKLGEQYIEQFP